MKRFINFSKLLFRLILLVCVALTLVSCGAAGEADSQPEPQAEAQEEPSTEGGEVEEAPVEPEVEQTLTVFAASSLTDAFTELGAAFEEANPGVTVALNFASSSQLAAQLIENVDADVYASANQKQMQNVVDAERITFEPVIFTTNRITICVPADNPAGLEIPEDLAEPGVGLVLAAPDVPVRNYSDQVIAALGDEAFQEAVYANMISEEANVRQVVTKVALGEADAGMVYTSDITPDVADSLMSISVPDESNVIAQYPVATLDNGNTELGQAFIDFVISDEGQAILQAWGFGVSG